MSPSRKRAAVEQLQSSFEVSERRACEVVGQPRSSQRYQAKVHDDEPRLVTRMLELARQYPRYGYRFITAKLRQEGWQVSAADNTGLRAEVFVDRNARTVIDGRRLTGKSQEGTERLDLQPGADGEVDLLVIVADEGGGIRCTWGWSKGRFALASGTTRGLAVLPIYSKQAADSERHCAKVSAPGNVHRQSWLLFSCTHVTCRSLLAKATATTGSRLSGLCKR